MNFERKRGNILELFDKVSQLPLLIISIVVAIYAGTSMSGELLTPAVIIAITPLIKLIKYLFTYYSIIDDQLIVESGIFNKKRVAIPLRSITAVDMTQNILYQIFKTYKIKIDNGSQVKGTVNGAEVEFALKEDLAFQFKRLVEKDTLSETENDLVSNSKLSSEMIGMANEYVSTGKDEIANESAITEDFILPYDQESLAGQIPTPGLSSSANNSSAAGHIKDYARPDRTTGKAMPTISSSPLDFIILGLLEQKAGYIIGLFPIVSLIAYVLGTIGMTPSEESVNTMLETFFSSGPILILILLALIALLIGATIMAIIRSIITFFGFRLSADSDKIHIEFGLLTKKKFTLPKEKINGIALKQNMLMRIFDRYQMEIMVIGYGDKSDQQVKQQPILFPIASKSKIKEIVETLLPDFEGEYYSEEKGKPEAGTSPKALRYFFINPGFFITTILFIESLITIFFEMPLYINEIMSINAWWIFVPLTTLIEIAVVASIYLQYRNTRIHPTPKNITVISGGYHRKISVIKTSSVESITAIASKWKRRRGFASIRLGYVAPVLNSKILVRNRALVDFKDLENVLEM
jgi:uncharacterized membrane protein YdbT with pleckstrin-like domain